jgi:hypothetical protein
VSRPHREGGRRGIANANKNLKTKEQI